MAEEQKNPETTINEEGPKKTSWPEVVGLTADEAEKKIIKDMLCFTEVHLKDQPVFCDYCDKRVRIFVDSDGKVAYTPHVG
ncbi:subtilisin inhibitor CLSI-I-like [Impatiens glandulifera]|uniref:subtilisin inhibitor CLSI-I-like n=1 Tax=Impatiens glandulifera TaxID=253017 RepID=UPI001FB1401C|nr:subtilisin inhibitor CLSI-I-like [Impatiens glandulifera]